MTVDLTIKGIQQAQRANTRAIAALKPSGALGRAVLYGVAALHRYVVSITHVWKYKGGGLRAAHRMVVEGGGNRARIYIDPGAVNPRGQKPSIYGPAEHARGGSHAFYARTAEEAGPKVLLDMAKMVEGEL